VNVPAIQQFLLTRFNVRYRNFGDGIGESRQWLEDRFDLFERFCVPTIAAQTFEDFEWIIFCDEGTGEEDLQRIRAFDPRIRIALTASTIFDPQSQKDAQPREREGYGPVLWRMHVHPFVKSGTEVVISTRLDNDDALNRHAFARLRDHLDMFVESGHDRWVYNPMHGYRLDTRDRKVYQSSLRNSPFQSRFERVGPGLRPLGALGGHHGKASELYPYYDDEEGRLWMMVVHGGNVSNRVGGKPSDVSIESILDDFPIKI
jgi:hypothetical protein